MEVKAVVGNGVIKTPPHYRCVLTLPTFICLLFTQWECHN